MNKLMGAISIDTHTDDIGIAKQIVKIAQCLLIGAYQKGTNNILFVGFEIMQLQSSLGIVGVDKFINLAVTVAGDVSDDALSTGLLSQAMDRHDRKNLINSPDIR